ncbi:hypothetical protein SPRG_06102 [Saprolegnia parasitica CBS 223.65]|uniref:START domain-containing protein n=1 Tax=Saprolegnia parasitica (strain CBS 223.65) TaxID=695850 RepID=A0A067CQE8_SAPPC|nr:hypothetical protein SPRG_06102 [Saprolegnia parasitica CBS 223.65]KDO29047.1 hypothetical protein SPRG_06102 [Saprolegnia parasitica CBS 223.65]|eukprot:XP_012200217.1 hypothetical protein SPRG_06102 [Saprolegnia parasitica CBS 223.65]
MLDTGRMLALEPAKKKYNKRTYNRERQRMLQLERIKELSSLKQQIADLEKTMAGLSGKLPALARVASTATGPLSWRDIAGALNEATLDSSALHASLRRKVARQDELVRHMSKWVTSMLRVEKPLDFADAFWKNISLTADPDARKLGCEWIADHLFHNTDKTFQQCGFPDPSCLAELHHFNLVVDEHERCQYGWNKQRLLPVSFENASRAFQKIHVDNSMGLGQRDFLDSDLLQTDAKRIDYSRHSFVLPDRNGPRVDWENWLCGEYLAQDRYVFVMRSIHTDPKYPIGTVQRNRMTWVVVDRIGPMTTRTREGAVVGCKLQNVPDHLKYQTFKQHMQRGGEIHAEKFTKQLMAAIESTRAQSSPP